MTDNDSLSRRRFLQATGGAATTVALAGCSGGGGSGGGNNTSNQSPNPEGDASNTLQLINSTMSTLDPVAADDSASGVVIQQMFDGLTNYPNGQIEPETLLATDYQVSDDYLTYTFTLKEGVQYHNGDELTAQDVVYSFERLAGSDNSVRQYFILESLGIRAQDANGGEYDPSASDSEYAPGSIAVTAEDDYTVSMELRRPFHSVLAMLAYSAFAVLPEGIVGDVGDYEGEIPQEEFATANPVGCGPFQFVNWESQTSAEVGRFDNYHGDVADLGGVYWQIMSDSNAMYNYFMNGNADATANPSGIPTPQYDPNSVSIESEDDLGRSIGTYGPVRNGQTLNYFRVPTVSVYYIGLNTQHVEKPARQAMAYAMNQQLIVDQVFKGRGVPAYHHTPKVIYPGGVDAYERHAQNSYPYGYNQSMLDQARQVMEDAGYSQSNRYSFTYTAYASSPTFQETGRILRDQLASCHIDMQLETAQFSTLQNRGENGDLQAYTLGWIMDWPAPDNFLQLIDPPRTDTSSGAPLSYVNWSGTPAANRAEQAWNTIQNNTAPSDQAQSARNQAYVTMEEANWEDVILLPVYHDLAERFWYDWADIPKFGAGGPSRQKHNHTTLSERSI